MKPIAAQYLIMLFCMINYKIYNQLTAAIVNRFLQNVKKSMYLINIWWASVYTDYCREMFMCLQYNNLSSYALSCVFVHPCQHLFVFVLLSVSMALCLRLCAVPLMQQRILGVLRTQRGEGWMLVVGNRLGLFGGWRSEVSAAHLPPFPQSSATLSLGWQVVFSPNWPC